MSKPLPIVWVGIRLTRGKSPMRLEVKGIWKRSGFGMASYAGKVATCCDAAQREGVEANRLSNIQCSVVPLVIYPSCCYVCWVEGSDGRNAPDQSGKVTKSGKWKPWTTTHVAANNKNLRTS